MFCLYLRYGLVLDLITGTLTTDPVRFLLPDQVLRTDSSVSNMMSTALAVSFIRPTDTLQRAQERERVCSGNLTVVRLKDEHRSEPDGPLSAPTYIDASLLARPHHLVSARTVKRDERAPVLSPSGSEPRPGTPAPVLPGRRTGKSPYAWSG